MIRKDTVMEALKIMGQSYLKQPYRGQWHPQNPTRGYCYVVSEMLYYIYKSRGNDVHPYRMNVEIALECPGDAEDTITVESHWFLVKDSEIVDWTAEQYGNKIKLDYTKARRAAFMTREPSKRAKELAKLLLALGGLTRG